jgi:hypothetical protein
MHGTIGIVLERAVLNELGVQAAVAGMIDFLEENTIERGADSCTEVLNVNIHYGLSACSYRREKCRSKKRRPGK